jgi:hypothetical protein
MATQRLRKLAHLAGQWVLITDERDDLEAQSVICSEEADGFPHDRIKSQWGYGRRITQVRPERPIFVFTASIARLHFFHLCPNAF